MLFPHNPAVRTLLATSQYISNYDSPHGRAAAGLNAQLPHPEVSRELSKCNKMLLSNKMKRNCFRGCLIRYWYMIGGSEFKRSRLLSFGSSIKLRCHQGWLIIIRNEPVTHCDCMCKIYTYIHNASPFFTVHLLTTSSKSSSQRWISVLYQLFCVCLPPQSSIRCTGSIDSWPTRSITFTARLCPYYAVYESAVRICRRWDSKASFNVAPIAPVCTGVLEAGTSLVDDEMGGQRVVSQVRRENFSVVQLVIGIIVLGVVCSWVCDVGIEVRDVGGEASD